MYTTAVYIINRLPSGVIGKKSPFEKLYSKKPSLHYLRVFGYVCFAKRLNETNKLSPRFVACAFVGYTETEKGYVLYDLTINVFLLTEMLYLKKVSSHSNCRLKSQFQYLSVLDQTMI